MSDAELRLELLKIAADITGPAGSPRDPDAIVKRATVLLEFTSSGNMHKTYDELKDAIGSVPREAVAA